MDMRAAAVVLLLASTAIAQVAPGALTGTAVDERAAPVIGAQVELSVFGDFGRRVAAVSTTDAHGRFALPLSREEFALEKDRFCATLSIAAAGKATTWWANIPAPLGGAEQGWVTVRPEVVVSGLVKSADGKPIPAAELRVAPSSSEWQPIYDFSHVTAISNERGEFTLRGLGSGTYGVLATATGHQRSLLWTRPLVGAQPPALDFELIPSTPVEISVIDENGAPVAGADLRVSYELRPPPHYGVWSFVQPHFFGSPAVSDERGRVVRHDLKSGDLIAVQAPGREMAKASISAERIVKVTAKKREPLRRKLERFAKAVPAPRARSLRSYFYGPRWQPEARDLRPEEWSQNGAELTVEQTDGVVEYLLVSFADGSYSLQYLQWSQTEAADWTCWITEDPGRTPTTLEILSPDASPQIPFEAAAFLHFPSICGLAPGPPPFERSIDTIALPVVLEGRRLSSPTASLEQARVLLRARDGRFQIAPPAKVESAGAPLRRSISSYSSPAKWVIEPPPVPFDGVLPVLIKDEIASLEPRWAARGASGWLLESASPGRYSILAMPNRDSVVNPLSFRSLTDDDIEYYVHAEANLVANTTTITKLPWRPIEWTRFEAFVERDGASVAGAGVWITAPGVRVQSITDTAGRFVLEVPKSGQFDLQVSTSPYVRARWRVDIPAAHSSPQVLHIDPINIRGRVVDERGGPLRAVITYEDYENPTDSPIVVKTDETGTFKLTSVPMHVQSFSIQESGRESQNPRHRRYEQRHIPIVRGSGWTLDYQDVVLRDAPMVHVVAEEATLRLLEGSEVTACNGSDEPLPALPPSRPGDWVFRLIPGESQQIMVTAPRGKLPELSATISIDGRDPEPGRFAPYDERVDGRPVSRFYVWIDFDAKARNARVVLRAP